MVSFWFYDICNQHESTTSCIFVRNHNIDFGSKPSFFVNWSFRQVICIRQFIHLKIIKEFILEKYGNGEGTIKSDALAT